MNKTYFLILPIAVTMMIMSCESSVNVEKDVLRPAGGWRWAGSLTALVLLLE